jgi:hypothetical protein
VKNVFAGFLIVLFVAGLYAKTVRADTDYRCLNECINGGKTASVCMPRCTYEPNAPEKKPSNKATSTHRQFSAPVPSEQLVINRPNHKAVDDQGKDYRCVLECAQSGQQYQFCEQRCVKQPTAGRPSIAPPQPPAAR